MGREDKLVYRQSLILFLFFLYIFLCYIPLHPDSLCQVHESKFNLGMIALDQIL